MFKKTVIFNYKYVKLLHILNFCNVNSLKNKSRISLGQEKSFIQEHFEFPVKCNLSNSFFDWFLEYVNTGNYEKLEN